MPSSISIPVYGMRLLNRAPFEVEVPKHLSKADFFTCQDFNHLSFLDPQLNPDGSCGAEVSRRVSKEVVLRAKVSVAFNRHPAVAMSGSDSNVFAALWWVI